MRTRTVAVAAIVTVAFGATTMTTTIAASPSSARNTSLFSFDTGDVRFAYSDGYYDHRRAWHSWTPDEAREFRIRYRERYWDGPSSRYPHRGWRDGNIDGAVKDKGSNQFQ